MNKGMSQTLTLVVIASVLMMTALTVAVLGRNTLIDSSDNLDRDACIQAVSGACGSADSDQTIPAPSSCMDEEGELMSVPGASAEGQQYQCS